MKLFVDIDVSSEDLKVCAMNTEGDTLDSFTVLNNHDGATFVRDKLIALTGPNKTKEIHIGFESTSVYSWHPAMFLHEDDALQKFETKVFTINPKLISKFREAYADLDKTDYIDA